jgi:CheY-like chemotaxis protein
MLRRWRWPSARGRLAEVMTMVRTRQVGKFKVLAVDDQRTNLLTVEAVLAEQCIMTLASSGSEAIEILGGDPDFDVVLMDLQMPGMDGFEATRRIKKMPECHDLPIIFITGVYTDPPFVRDGYDAGAVDYLSKPFDIEILRKKVAIYGSCRQRAALFADLLRKIDDPVVPGGAGGTLGLQPGNVAIGIIVTDASGHLREANSRAPSICGGSGDGGRHAWWEQLGWWDESGRMIEGSGGPLIRILRGPDAFASETVELCDVNGRLKTVHTSVSRLAGIDGNPTGVVVVIRDARQLRPALEKVKEAGTHPNRSAERQG